MNRKFPNLCSPIKIGQVEFKNRMFSAPMGGTDITDTGCIGRKSMKFYELRAKGGAAAVCVSECMVHPESDGSHAYHLDLSVNDSLASFTYTADAIFRHGAIASIELSHSGQYAGTYMSDKNKKAALLQWGVSAGKREDGTTIQELTKAMINEIIEAYGKCASLAKRAGFGMIMIHGGHGWLINQFLSPYFNHREDEYGGCFENRVRFAKEVIQSVRDAVGYGFPIEFRMSGSELFEGGYDIDEGIKIAMAIENEIDLIHVSAGTYQRGFGLTHPSMFEEHGRNVYLAAEIKKHVKKPVATIGGLNDPIMMEEIIASGKADVVEMARALLADPALPKKVLANEDELIVKCLRCFTCMAERAVTSTRRCSINPQIGREDEPEMTKAITSKKVMVIGGGCGGLKAAHTAALRGHRVVLYEKERELGGILKSEQAIPFKYEMYELGITLEKLARKAGVEIHLQTEVTQDLITNEQPDAVIVAIGSQPLAIHMEGMKQDHVSLVNDYYLNQDKISHQVILIGGGLAGCELAIHLCSLGKTVKIIEMRQELAVDANVRQRPILLEKLKQGVEVYTQLKAIRIEKSQVICLNPKNEEVCIQGTSVILALGQAARSIEAKQFSDCAKEVVYIGDCVRASTITQAMYQGHHAALDL